MLLGSFAPLLLGWPVAGGRLELLGAYCVETAQFFFDHFREMQYPPIWRAREGGGRARRTTESCKNTESVLRRTH